VSSSELIGRVVRELTPLARRGRRALLVRRIQVQAASVGSTVEVDIALDALVGTGIRVEIAPGTTSRLRLGARVLVGDGVVLLLKGGSIDIGPWTDLRRGVVLNVSGELVVGQEGVLGAGTTVHCAHEVTLGDRVGIGEYTSIVDTSHHHTEPGRPVVNATRTGAVRVGQDVFIGAKSTLTRGCVVGDFAFVGASSVVVGEVPDRSFVSGIPATFVRSIELPWE
jgi:acetyltransferase-like isoleucine patch superfamily enzyme